MNPWTEIKRTVNGVPVDHIQIQMIVDKICESLNLSSGDTLLDLGSGNGALAELLPCKVIKVDPEPLSLGIIRSTADGYLECSQDEFNKVLIYGAFSYFPRPKRTLRLLSKTNVESVFIGNLPDAERADNFLTVDMDLGDHTTPLGKWWSQREFLRMAESHGFSCKFSVMPEDFYASHYRFDALLT